MDKSIKIMSDITVFSKYAKYDKSKKRRETWEEICLRNRDMHLKKYPQLHSEIVKVYEDFIIPKKVLPSMRSMQFAGKPIEVSPNRIFNCAYGPADSHLIFSEAMFLLLGGTGLGYSVQRHHVEKIGEIVKPGRSRRFLVEDSIQGWANAVKKLMEAYFKGKSMPIFDFSDIRQKGAELVTSGGKAPGPEPLKTCLFNLQRILDRKQLGEKLSTLEAHDMLCFVADAVLSGGIRRAALISLFDVDDEEMLTCKFGNWWELNPQRGRANNSAVVIRHKVTKDTFTDLWKKIQASGSGEPGLYFSNNADWGTNPCCEIALRP
jgi:ribonucleoside-diphosphate reductase alpha chain